MLIDKIKKVVVGEFVVEKGDKVDITDPGYSKDIWCRINDVEVKDGVYSCIAYIDENDTYGWGVNRVWGIEIVKQDEKVNKWNAFEEGIGVDAGLAGFFINKPDFDDGQWYKLCDTMEESMMQDNIRAYLFKRYDWGWEGFCSQSGCGDGGYEVFKSVDKNNKINGLRIDFLGRE